MTHPSAIPVRTDFTDHALGAAVTRWVEGHLGWQVVADSPHLPARLHLADRPLPGVVLVTRDPHAVHDGPVVVWPDQAEALRTIVPDPLPRPRGTTVLVGGAAGGVGTSTVALALAAAHAWSGTRTWLVAGPVTHAMLGVPSGPVAEVPAAPGLAVTADPAVAARRCGAEDRVVVDAGVLAGASVLVARPDAALIAALDAAPDGTRRPGVVVTVGQGALRPDEVARLLQAHPVEGRRHVHLPWDLRIGRAALRGRLPGDLPGRWVHSLATGTGAVAA